MNEEWRTSKLHSVADVRVSNVDKKFYATETPVRLCNYMDVYTNDYVTAAIDFMTASASKAQIERFGLMAGDVVITKDSETPDDIGVSAVIAEQISGLVCGYHLALIRPRDEAIDPVYLAKQLRSSGSIKYFAANASGSTRFGLSIGAIENLEIPLAPRPEQTIIGEIFVTVDRAIEQTEALIAKQQRIRTGLMQDLLTRGIDEHGNLRSEQTHEFKNSPLGRIPAAWEPTHIGNAASLQRGHDITESQLEDGPYPVISSSGVIGYHNESTSRGPNVVVGRKGTIGKVHYVESDFWAHDTSLFVTNFFGNNPRFIYYLFILSDLARFGTKSGSPSLNRNDVHPLWFGRPSPEEQGKIVKVLLECEALVKSHAHGLDKVKRLKTALMQDLLTGNRRVTALLNKSEQVDA